MKKRLAAFYFSGTGNTRYVTRQLCKRLAGAYDAELFDIARCGAADGAIARADLVVLAFPVYGSCPPVPMRRFVFRNARLWQGKEIVIVATQYFFSGDGAASLGRTVEKLGGRVDFAEHFDMPNNMADCRLFPIRNGAGIASVLQRADRKLDRFAARILSGRRFRRGFHPLARAVGYLSQRALWRRHECEKRDALTVDPDRCTGCGLCARSCPVGNLRVERGKALPLGQCALCYRCINLCPARALTLVGAAPPQTQYQGPPASRD